MQDDKLFQAAFPFLEDVLGLPVKDIDKAAEWYGNAFGLTEVERRADPAPTVIMERDGVQVGFAVNGGVAENDGVAILVTDIHRARRELEANGVRRIVLLTDDLSRYKQRSTLAKMTELRPRDDIEEVLADLEATPGTTAMIYDQMCAAEKRRRRNRGLMPQPVRRIMINERVCEGCGDCVTQSNCVSLHPVERSSIASTRCPSASKDSIRCEPMKPAPPVTR